MGRSGLDAALSSLDIGESFTNVVELGPDGRTLPPLDGVETLSESGNLFAERTELIRQGLLAGLGDGQLPNETAEAGGARDVAVSREPAHRTLSGCDSDAEGLREVANGRQLGPRLPDTRLDLADELVGDGLVRVPCAG